MRKLRLLICFVLLHQFLFAASPVRPVLLTCEYLSNPIAIDISTPRFAWNFSSAESNQLQSAYEIIVSDNVNDITKGAGNAWQTGKINSSQSLHISYAGAELKPATKYYWCVKIYDGKGQASEWSEPASFVTGLFSTSGWSAQWIGDGKSQPAKEEDYYKDDPMPLLRKSFSLKKKVSSAILFISGLGYYEAYLNGKKISENVLDPGFTTYGKQVLYVGHDITSMVKKGENVAGIILGNGWWNPLPFKLFGRWDLRDFQQTGRPCVIAEYRITYTDGTTEKIITDESWQAAPGPILRNNIYLGEHYDAREEKPDWLTTKKLKGWTSAVAVRGPRGVLTAQLQPPIKITVVVKPISIKELSKGVYIVDMGQNFAGVARIKVKGVAGTKITMRFGEGIFADGTLNVMTTVATQIKKGGIKGGPGAPETAWQEDSYTLKGAALETWAPKFTFHGFQYIEIKGWPGVPTVNDIEGLRMNSDLELRGSFACSNEQLNKLHDVIQWTFLSNVFSVQSDCPAREKMGYGADMVVSANAFMYNYDMANFYRKAVRDFANEQRPKGGMTEIAPFTGIDDRGYGDLSGPLGWQLAFPYLQKQLYEFYGDSNIIKENYPALQKQISFLQSQAKNNLFYWDISDHEALDPRPEAFSASLFYYHHVLLASEFATLLKNPVDTARYRKLADGIKRSIINQYAIPNSGRFDNGTQSAQLFALWYKIAPDKGKAFDQLVSEFERHKWHVSTGIFSTTMLFDVLRENNRNDLAYKIASQPDYPGWLNMINNGATTLWETWKFPETGPSRNHPMFGSIDEWFYRSLLGINQLSPGFSKIQIKPQPVAELNWAKGSYQSVRGTISSDWKKENGKFVLNIGIPPNTTAEVWVPSKLNVPLTQNKQTIAVDRYVEGYAIVTVGSGSYEFVTAL
ncbi:MAG: family 78 glycoside hydrolase catalytic domain [Chitinophagaceae bacterium]|nr:family 78 glycoside hydrolase catalytic domain [Chitinophagaceae bacterium]